ATELPSGARSGPSRENQKDSVRAVASAGIATGWTITNADRDGQLPSERPPIRPAYRPVRTIAAVVPASCPSTMLTPPQPVHGAAPSSKPPFCSSSWARASGGASRPAQKEPERKRPRRTLKSAIVMGTGGSPDRQRESWRNAGISQEKLRRSVTTGAR